MARRPSGPPEARELYRQLLLFPERAEYLEQTRFDGYQVHLEHWRDLSTEFRRAFEAVYTRGSASVLLVHGEQGTGKTLFARRVEDDFEEVRTGRVTDERENLWLVLAGGQLGDPSIGREAAKTTALRRVSPQPGWLADERTFAGNDEHGMRVFLIDDAHKNIFLCEWAGLPPGDYLRLQAEGKESIVLESVAQQLVADCRGEFQRSLFVLLSNDQHLLERFHEELERSHAGLSKILRLPLPESELKEKIVRTNINRLNRQSYWYCLDRGGPSEKRWAYQTLTSEGGFTDSFRAIDRALGAAAARTGRPANKNTLTLVTVGSDPLTVQSYIRDRELQPDEEQVEKHLGCWLFRQKWASALAAGDTEYARRAELLESEFTLRWVTIDMKSIWWLTAAPPDDPVCAKLVDIIRILPSIGTKKKSKEASEAISSADAEIASLNDDGALRDFERHFRDSGRSRSLGYEATIAARFDMQISCGLIALPTVRPDIKLAEYEPCAVTRATSDDVKAIETAIRRACHVIEFTAYLQPDMRRLDDYLRDKVDVYATLLESV